jgi:hypothetical protein
MPTGRFDAIVTRLVSFIGQSEHLRDWFCPFVLLREESEFYGPVLSDHPKAVLPHFW